MPKWSEKEIEIIRKNFQLPKKQLAQLLPNRSITAIKSFCTKHGFIKPVRRWTPEKDKILKEKYADTLSQDLADEFGVSLRAVYQRARILKLNKSKEFIANNARKNLLKRDHPAQFTQFRKGMTPWNKGKKGLIFKGSEKGHFKKGHRPHNSAKIGDTVKLTGYWKIKVADPNQWEFIHRKVWESNYGKIPKNHIVTFKDGNSDNYHIENLELISRSKLMKRNTIHNLPEDIKQTLQTIGHLRRRINNAKK